MRPTRLFMAMSVTTVLLLSSLSLGEINIMDGWVTEKQFIPGATVDTIADILPVTPLDHPQTGQFSVSLEVDDDPVMVGVGYTDPSGQEVMVPVQAYLMQINEFAGHGWLDYSSLHFSGVLYSERGDITLSGEWVLGGLELLIGASNPDEGAGFSSGESDQLSSDEGDDSDEATAHDHSSSCETLIATDELPAGTDCGTFEEQAPDTIVGDDQEIGFGVGSTSTPNDVLKVKVYHENQISDITAYCKDQDKRLFGQETAFKLKCTAIDVGSQYDVGNTNGWDDWQNFLDAYYSGLDARKSSTEFWNGGRFVMFVVNEGTILKPNGKTVAGTTQRCAEIWDDTTRQQPCGHGVVYNRQSSYFKHSAAFREGQTFGHELIHLIDADHDTTVDSKNYNGKEGCWGWGDDFQTHNVMFWTAQGTACDHRHYWLTTSTENAINTKAPDHVQRY